MVEWARPLDALIANDLDGALEWYEKRRANIVNQPANLYNWARLLCSLDRRAEAEPFFDRLADVDDYAMFVAGQRLIGAIGGGLSPEQALNVTPLGAAERHRAAIAAALAEFDITRRPPPARHIAISGIAFCGSTLMDLLLEGVPGVASIGESVWLTLGWIDQKGVPFNYSEPRGRGVQGCNYCGGGCEVLTANFRTAMGLNPVDWYLRIAEQLGTAIIVSADKNLPKTVLMEPRLRLTGLVVFKSPKQAWASTYSKTSAGKTPEQTFQGMVNFLDVWKWAYGEMARTFKPVGGKVFLDFDRFTHAPEAMFRSMVRALDLEYDPAAFVKPEPGHSLGGNNAAIRRVRSAGHSVDVYPLGEPDIPAEHAEWIDSQADLTELHALLEQLSEDDLARAA